MLKKFVISNGKLIEGDGEGVCVYVYLMPDEKEKAYLTTDLRIDEHTLHSSMDPEEVGRIEFEADHLAAIIKRPKKYCAEDNLIFKISSVGLFLYSDKLILVLNDEDLNWENRIFSKMHSVHDIFLKVIFYCVVHFEEHLKVIRKISEELETEINEAVSNKDVLNMFKLSKNLVYYVDAINSNSKVIERLKMTSAKIGLDRDVEYLDDLTIESHQCYQQASSYLEVLSGMIDARASIVNNNLNIRLKRLTIVSICIMTPTLVVSFFSMNLPLPIPQTIHSFWVVTTMAFLSVLGLLFIGLFKKL